MAREEQQASSGTGRRDGVCGVQLERRRKRVSQAHPATEAPYKEGYRAGPLGTQLRNEYLHERGTEFELRNKDWCIRLRRRCRFCGGARGAAVRVLDLDGRGGGRRPPTATERHRERRAPGTTATPSTSVNDQGDEATSGSKSKRSGSASASFTHGERGGWTARASCADKPQTMRRKCDADTRDPMAWHHGGTEDRRRLRQGRHLRQADGATEQRRPSADDHHRHDHITVAQVPTTLTATAAQVDQLGAGRTPRTVATTSSRSGSRTPTGKGIAGEIT